LVVPTTVLKVTQTTNIVVQSGVSITTSAPRSSTTWREVEWSTRQIFPVETRGTSTPILKLSKDAQASSTSTLEFQTEDQWSSVSTSGLPTDAQRTSTPVSSAVLSTTSQGVPITSTPTSGLPREAEIAISTTLPISIILLAICTILIFRYRSRLKIALQNVGVPECKVELTGEPTLPKLELDSQPISELDATKKEQPASVVDIV